MNTWHETVIYYRGKLKTDSTTLLKAYRFAVEVMSYTTKYAATDIGIGAKGWKPLFLPIKEYGIKFEEYLKNNGEIKDFNVYSRIFDSEMIYECIQFEYRIEEKYLMFSFNNKIANELDLERIAFIMKQMMEEIQEGEIFETESSREISGYITEMYGEEELEWKEKLYDLVDEFNLIEEKIEAKNQNWGNISIEELI